MEVFVSNALVSFMTLVIVLYTAYAVWNHCHPRPRNWIEFDCWDGRKSFTQHLMDCGLIYPCLYIYIWLAVQQLLKQAGF